MNSKIDIEQKSFKKQRNDFVFLKNLYKYFSLVGVTPIMKKKVPIFQKIIIIISLMNLIMATYVSLAKTFENINRISKIFGAIFGISCVFFPNVVYKKEWILFEKRFHRLDSMLAAFDYKSKERTDIQFCLRFITFTTIVLGFCCFNVSTILFHHAFKFEENYLRMVIHVYITMVSVIFYYTISLLQSRYTFL